MAPHRHHMLQCLHVGMRASRGLYTREDSNSDRHACCQPPAFASRVQEGLPIPYLVYEHAKSEAAYNVPINRGSEASAFVQYILDHYACLPRWTLFLHAHGSTEHHGFNHRPTDVAHSAALIDVDAMARQGGHGFVAIGHHRAPTLRVDQATAHAGSHRMTVVSRKSQCSCADYRAVVGESWLSPSEHAGAVGCSGILSRRTSPWAFPAGAEFWASAARIHDRSLASWRSAMDASVSVPFPFSPWVSAEPHKRFAGTSEVTPIAYCFESLWHHLLGEPLTNYSRIYDTLEQHPHVAFEQRARDSGAGGGGPRRREVSATTHRLENDRRASNE